MRERDSFRAAETVWEFTFYDILLYSVMLINEEKINLSTASYTYNDLLGGRGHHYLLCNKGIDLDHDGMHFTCFIHITRIWTRLDIHPKIFISDEPK